MGVGDARAAGAARVSTPASARGERYGSRIAAGMAFFGLGAGTVFLLCQFWNPLGIHWGPGVPAAMALGFFILHVGLVRNRVSAIDPLIWLPVSMLLFYFGMPFAIEVVGYDGGGGYDAWDFGLPKDFARGYAAALLTMVSFLWGLYLAGVRDLSKGPEATLPPQRAFAVPALAFTLGSLLMMAFGIALVGPSVAFGAYSEWGIAKEAIGVDQRFLDTGVVFSVAGVFALIASSSPREKALRRFAYCVSLVLALVTVQKGDRAGLVGLGIGAGWCYTQRVRRIPWLPVLGAAVVLLAIMPVLVEWREYKSLELSRTASFKELLGAAAAQMGGSVNSFVHTIELIPLRKGYAWGLTYWAALVNAVPNVLPTKGANPWTVTDLESAPSAWLSSIIAPEWWALGGGFGYSMGAEWYYNFGMPGILIGCTLIGYLVGRVRNGSVGSPLRLVASAMVFFAMAGHVRNTFGYPFRTALWPLIGLAIVTRVSRVLMRSPRRIAARAPVPRAVASLSDPRSFDRG